MLGLLTAVIIFHIFILAGIVPYEIVWAGKLQSVQEMYVFEAISISINAILITVLLLKGNFIKLSVPAKLLDGVLWFFVAVFALNTVGNLMAETLFEKAFFTPLTFLSAVLIWIIVRKNPDGKQPVQTKAY